MRLDQWLREAADRLSAAGIESAALEAQVIAAFVLKQDRTWVLTHGDSEVDTALLERVVTKRLIRVPLAYLLGFREFYGRRFKVTPDVLIPRQETELLVELAISTVVKGASVLDIGTGSGCIAVTIKAERPDLSVTAVDLSAAALEVAKSNALSHEAEIEFLHGDLLEPIQHRRFDLIVSNPPYIAEDAELMPEVGDHEPALALYSGISGLEHYQRLIQGAESHLNPGGLLMLELGYGQADAVRSMLTHQMVSIHKDLSGIERVLIANW